MKLLRSLAVVVAAMLMFTAYGQDAKPSDVVKKFVEATVAFDFAAAKQYVIKEHQAKLDEVIAQFEAPEAKAQIDEMKAVLESVGGIKVDIVNEEIDGDSAKVTVQVSGGGQSQEQVISLIKEDGKWKVNDDIGM